MSRAAYMRDYRAKRVASLSDGGLLPFQKRFVDALTRKQAAPEIGILGSPRAQGKSWLCGRLIGRSLTPGDVLHEDSVENVLVASSRSQASITLEFARQALADVPEIRWSNDGAIHVASRRGSRSSHPTQDARAAWAHTRGGCSVTSRLLGLPRRDVGSSTLCERLLENESVRLCCVGRLRHLRRKVQGVGGLNASRLAAARASTSNCCRRTKKSGGIGTNVCASIRLTS